MLNHHKSLNLHKLLDWKAVDRKSSTKGYNYKIKLAYSNDGKADIR